MSVRDAMFEFEDWLSGQPMLIALPVIAVTVTVLIGGVAALFIAPFVWMSEHQPAFSLAKAEWECAASHEVYVPERIVGKVIEPAHWDSICDQYQRKG